MVHFWMLDARRQRSPFALQPLTWLDFLGYASFCGVTLAPWQWRALCLLDDANLAAYAEMQAAQFQNRASEWER